MIVYELKHLFRDGTTHVLFTPGILPYALRASLRCPRCGAPLRVLAAITNPRVINAILTHCDLREDGARGPPTSARSSLH